MLIMKNNDLNR